MDEKPTIEAPHIESATFEKEKPLKLDSNGIPLDPQPSDSPDDPLNWPYWGKVYVSSLLPDPKGL